MAIMPIQDVLGLGSEARMNVPSEADGSWRWRLQRGALTAELATKLADLVSLTDRDDAQQRASVDGQQGERKAAEEFAA